MPIGFDHRSPWINTSIANGALERIDSWYDDGTYNDEDYINALIHYFSSAFVIVDYRGKYSAWMKSLDIRIQSLEEKSVDTRRLQLLEEVWAEKIDSNDSPEIVLNDMREGRYNRKQTEDEAWKFREECEKMYFERVKAIPKAKKAETKTGTPTTPNFTQRPGGDDR